MRIFLTGFMGAGKTTVGRELAARLEATFVDLDQLIEERAGAGVAEIFARVGESGFRLLERRALAEVASRADDPLVVATGGGTVTDVENHRRMAACGTIVWLDADFEVLSDRLAASAGERPLFGDPEEARRLLERRLGAYGRADVRLRLTAEEAPGEVASRILDVLDDRRCDT